MHYTELLPWTPFAKVVCLSCDNWSKYWSPFQVSFELLLNRHLKYKRDVAYCVVSDKGRMHYIKAASHWGTFAMMVWKYIRNLNKLSSEHYLHPYCTLAFRVAFRPSQLAFRVVFQPFQLAFPSDNQPSYSNPLGHWEC